MTRGWTALRTTQLAVVAALALALQRGAAAEEPAPARLGAAYAAEYAAADLVFVGRIVRLGEPPPAGSGIAVFRQNVVYDVVRVLAGRCHLARVEVGHVIAGGPTQDPAPDTNRLHPRHFAPGRVVVTCAALEKSGVSERSDHYVLANDNERLVPLLATDGTVRAIAEALGAK